MKTFRLDIWQDGEYNYKAAYGFVPNMRFYLHDDDKKRPMMLVVPGGGYCMVVSAEAEIIAMEFYNLGMNAAVLTYTTDITMSVPLEKQPLNDVSRAVRIIRNNAQQYNVIPNQITICGFSAGGHLCASLCTHWKDIDDSVYKVSNRPDSAILSYPVITTGEYTHIYSVWALIGQNASKEKMDYFSCEKNVDEDTPPCFIWQTREDDLVPVENSYLMAKALKKAGVEYAHYVFPYGGHGLSIPKKQWFQGDFGEPYTFEQLDKAVAAVKEGRAFDVSPQRYKELLEQFPDEPENNKEEETSEPEAECKSDDDYPFPEVRLWPTLAEAWLKQLYNKNN